MKRRYKVVVLCGNPEFMESFMKEQRKLTRAGNIVMGVASYDNYTYGDLSTSEEILLDSMVKQQIEMADEMLVINKNDKINESVENNIRYAFACGKPIRYMEKHYARNRSNIL